MELTGPANPYLDEEPFRFSSHQSDDGAFWSHPSYHKRQLDQPPPSKSTLWAAEPGRTGGAQYVKKNKEKDNDWFKLESNEEGTRSELGERVARDG